MRIKFNKKYALWALALLGIEFLIATVFSRIGFIRGYIGDVLVVILIEVLQYFGVATYLGFTKGSLGYIILGNHFSWGDILSYAIGCLILQLTTRN